MKPILRECLTDLKAAVRIGHPDAVQSALDNLRSLPDELVPPNDLPALGIALVPLPIHMLTDLFNDPDPAIRALASIALGEHYLSQKDVQPGALTPAANDPNPEVRRVFAQFLLKSINQFYDKEPAFERLHQLVLTWANSKFPIITETALQILTGLSLSAEEVYQYLEPLDKFTEHHVRAELVQCLNTLGDRGYQETIFFILTTWSQRSEPNVWVITRALSGSWAQANSERAVLILNQLAKQIGQIRAIKRALSHHQVNF